MRLFGMLLAVAFVFSAVACATTQAKKDPTPVAPSGPPAHRQRIIIAADHFHPASMRAEPDTEIIWENKDATSHQVTASGMFDSGAIAPEGSFSARFANKGTYNYSCPLHNVAGSVVIE